MRKPRSPNVQLIRDLDREFNELKGSLNPQRRGYDFEDLLIEFFRRNGFTVRKSPLSTYPKQTDFLAFDRDLTVLGSAKWEKSRVGRSEIDALRLRLEAIRLGTRTEKVALETRS